MNKDSLLVINRKPLSIKQNSVTISEFYDKTAPACYGEILRIVSNQEISNRILVRVYVDAYNNKISVPKYLTPFTSIINYSRKKSLTTLKAIKIFQECNNSMRTIPSQSGADI